jgi:hypothetical protein
MMLAASQDAVCLKDKERGQRHRMQRKSWNEGCVIGDAVTGHQSTEGARVQTRELPSPHLERHGGVEHEEVNLLRHRHHTPHRPQREAHDKCIIGCLGRVSAYGRHC